MDTGFGVKRPKKIPSPIIRQKPPDSFTFMEKMIEEKRANS
jgi:hypothetical protein